MLRPGRLGKLLYVPLPQATDRNSILQALTKFVASYCIVLYCIVLCCVVLFFSVFIGFLVILIRKINIRKEGDDAVDIHKISLDERANGLLFALFFCFCFCFPPIVHYAFS